MNLIDVPAGCELASEAITVERAGLDGQAGWRDRTVLSLVARDGCRSVTIHLPPGVHLRDHAARLRLGDDSKRRPGPERWVFADRGESDVGAVTVLLPELVGGDRAELTFTREWTGFAWYATPFEDRAATHTVTFPADIGHDAPTGASVTAWDPGASLPETVTTERGLTVDAAWQRVAAVRVVPRGIDGSTPISGDAGLARGAMDDRGIARTLVALTRGGPEPLELAWIVPNSVTPAGWHPSLGPARQAAEVAIRRDQGKLLRELIPPNVSPTGHIWTADGKLLTGTTSGRGGAKQDLPVQIADTTTLVIPDGDPQIRLYPGGGSKLDRQLRLDFPASDQARTYLLPFPTGPASEQWEVGRGFSIRRREDATLLVVPPSPDDPVRVSIHAEQANAPTCGATSRWPNAITTATVIDPKGVVKTDENGFWWLAEHAGKPVMPDRERVLKGLSWRFNAASYPEPALPVELRGVAASWDLVAAARDAALDGVAVAPLAVLGPSGTPADGAHWPRRLARSRREQVMTPLEASLTLKAMLTQARVPAEVVLVRPVDAGAGPQVCAEEYPDPLVRVRLGDETRWLDLSCDDCGPFEVAPNHAGAVAFALDVARTPELPPAKVEASWVAGTWEVKLNPTAALALRARVAAEASANRSRRLAEILGGYDATLVSVTGFDEAGAPASVTVRPADPRTPLPSGWADDDRWPFTGEIRYQRPALPDGRPIQRVSVPTSHGDLLVAFDDGYDGPRRVDTAALSFERRLTANEVVETWQIRDRQVPRADLDATAAPVTEAPASAPTPFDALRVVTTPIAGRAVAAGSVVRVDGIVSDALARVSTGPDTSEAVRRAELRALPATVPVTRPKVAVSPSPAGKPLAQLAQPEVTIEAIDRGFVRVTTVGPKPITGWIPADALDLGALPSSSRSLGDWTLDVWSRLQPDRVVLDKAAQVRGVVFPPRTLVTVDASGSFTGVELVQPWSGADGWRLPEGARLAFTATCGFELDAPIAARVGGEDVAAHTKTCLVGRAGWPTDATAR